MGDIKLLDCTLRDGGLGLEDAFKNGISNRKFSTGKIDNIIRSLSHSAIEIVELGSIEITKDDRCGYAIYQDVSHVSLTIPKERAPGQMYVGLFRGPDTPMEDIPDWNPTLVDGLRVIIRYSELQKSLDFCEQLSQKGYKVFVQPMLTMRYAPDEIHQIIDAANRMKAFSLYFVDSYGYMQESDVLRFSEIYDQLLDENIHIGFHAHNNMNLAYSNVLRFIKYFENSERAIIIDSCAEGMGQGAGNLQTELIAAHLMQSVNKLYDFDSILQICEEVDEFSNGDLWGYSPTRLLPAIHKTAYKYAIVFRNKYKLSYKEINKILSLMPEEMRYRYISENAEYLINSILL